MKTFLKILTILTILIFSLSKIAFSQNIDPKILDSIANITKEEALMPSKHDIIYGNENAKVTIVEYASLSCSHCAHFALDVFPEIKEKYIDTGKVRFIYKHFPLDISALKASQLVGCIEKDKEQRLNKVFFKTQSNWAGKKNYLEVLSNITKLAGMKSEDFESCIADKDTEYNISLDKFKAVKVLEVKSTPTFFINGEIYKGAKDFSYFAEIIDAIYDKK